MMQITLFTKQTHRLREQACHRGRGIVKEFGIHMYVLLYLKWITNRDLLYSTWNSAQCCVAAGWEGSLGENGSKYMCGRVP